MNLQKFVLLGEKSYLGKHTFRSLSQLNKSVEFVASNLKKIEELDTLNNHVFDGAVTMNFIASGVASKEISSEALQLSNIYLLSKLFTKFLGSNGTQFIHFGSNYELKRSSEIVPQRLPYVKSKILSSNLCKEANDLDPRIRLLYLPTIISGSQPRGRFFRDFVESSRTGDVFYIDTPRADIEFSTYDFYFDYLYEFVGQNDPISQVPSQGICSVMDFAEIINDIIEDLGFERVKIQHSSDGGGQPGGQLEVSQSCWSNLRLYVAQILGRDHV